MPFDREACFMNAIKKVLVLFLTLSMLFSSSCSSNTKPKSMEIEVYDNEAAIVGYYGDLETVYFPPSYDGVPVNYLVGRKHLFTDSKTSQFDGPSLERVYLPWCTRTRYDRNAKISFEVGAGVTMVYARNDDAIPYARAVVSQLSYQKYLEKGMIGGYSTPEQYIEPANVAYLFNYGSAPNSNYFFIDLVESTGRLEKPPYDPERKGYAFLGWYKDAACTMPWDFERDVVEVSYDKYGIRIQEELCLYAKWQLAVPILWLYNYPDAPSKNIYTKVLEAPSEAITAPPEVPTRDGYTFVGWYKDAECTVPFVPSSDTVPKIEYNSETGQRIYDEIWLYAKWEKNHWWEFWK